MREKIKAAKDLENEADILILGDSSAGNAINARELQKQTGLKSFNFALIGDATLAGNYLILEEYIAGKKSARHAIMMNVYDVWHRSPCTSDEIAALFLKNYPKILIGLNPMKVIPQGVKDKLRMAKRCITNCLPSLLYRYEIRRFLKNPLEFLRESSERVQASQKDIYQKKGTSVNPEADKTRMDIDIEEHRKHITGVEFRVSPWNRYFLGKFLKKTRENNIEVLICYSPFHEKLHKKVKGSSHLSAYKYFIAGIADSYDNVRILNDDFYLAGEEKMSNADHLLPQEALVFTRMISKKINKLR